MPKKRHPTALKKLRGTLNTTRDLDNELTFKPLKAIPDPPGTFNDTMKQLWLTCTSSLLNVGLLFYQDLPLLEQYVFCVFMIKLSQKEIAEQGAVHLQQNKKGLEYQAKTKWISINLEYSKEATRIGREFGFTPSARTQIGVDKHFYVDTELDKIMFGD